MKDVPGPVQPAVTMTTQDEGAFPSDGVSAGGRQAALVKGSKVRQ